MIVLVSGALADDAVKTDTRADEAFARYGLDGTGVVIAVLDRGIDYEHPDFRNPDGSSRILHLLDMTGQNLCNGGPAPIEYTKADIDAALASGVPLATRDAVGHGTVTAGLAAGNGSASPAARFAGAAPAADLIIIKMTSEGAPAHGSEPAEAPFQACLDDALDWLDERLVMLGDPPCVGLINSGTQWGPSDGTSAVSRKIDEVFGEDRPGRVHVAPSGDEGDRPTHAQTHFAPGTPGEVPFGIYGNTQYFCVWYSGGPASVSIELSDGASSGPLAPGRSSFSQGVDAVHYRPGQAFYPWTSSGPDHALWVRVSARVVSGVFKFESIGSASGTADVTAPDFANNVALTGAQAPGRLTDYASTRSATTVGCHVARTTWTDVNGVTRSDASEGETGELWRYSSGGPTRDGRRGVAVSAPGHNAFAAYAPRSWWARYNANLHEVGDGLYGRAFATSASAPIVAGSVALMLQMDPSLTGRDVVGIIEDTARADAQTGAVPNNTWGFGKLDVLAALDLVRLGVCPTDLTTDGTLNLDDLDAFVTRFLAGDLVADLDANGVFNADDLDLFFPSFLAGCP